MGTEKEMSSFDSIHLGLGDLRSGSKSWSVGLDEARRSAASRSRDDPAHNVWLGAAGPEVGGESRVEEREREKE